MESVMNFLADYYIWFFVAAIVLCFALIGFVIESKKKQKSDFKGESIESNSSDTGLGNVTSTENTSLNENSGTEEVPVVESFDNSNVKTEANNDVNLEETMNISDMPLTSEMDVPKAQPIEFYNGPIEMPANNVQEDNTLVSDESLKNTSEVYTEPQMTATIGEAISYDTNVNNNQYSSFNQNNLEQSNVQENQEKPEDFNIFDNLK